MKKISLALLVLPLLLVAASPLKAYAQAYYGTQVVTTPYWCGSYWSSWPCNQQPVSYYYPYTNNNYYPANYSYPYSYQYKYSSYPYYQDTYCPSGYYYYYGRCCPYTYHNNYGNYGYPYNYYYQY